WSSCSVVLGLVHGRAQPSRSKLTKTSANFTATHSSNIRFRYSAASPPEKRARHVCTATSPYAAIHMLENACDRQFLGLVASRTRTKGGHARVLSRIRLKETISQRVVVGADNRK